MKVIQTHVEIGDDRMLHVRLPQDAPTGALEVLVVWEPTPTVDLEARRKAAKAGLGSLAGLGMSTDDFLAERQEDDRRRDAALGL